MKRISVSAPGKLVLLGEHAVVYGRHAIVTAMDSRMSVTIETVKEKDFILDAPEVGITNYKKTINNIGNSMIPKEVVFVETAVKNFIKLYPLKVGIHITTRSAFSSKIGFGSSSAVTVCVIKVLAELLSVPISQKEIFDLAYKTVLQIQQKGSGVDVAAAVYGGTLFFKTGGEEIEKLNVSYIPLIVGFSGKKVDTVEQLNKVKEKAEKRPRLVEKIYDTIEEIVIKGKESLEHKDFPSLGKLMNENQTSLAKLGVSTEKLDMLIAAANQAGAYGAKLSGGGGDCMIALSNKENVINVQNAIAQNGGEIISAIPNAEGVRVE